LDGGERLGIMVSGGGRVVLVDTLGEESLDLGSIAAVNRNPCHSWRFDWLLP
jgi:hypothetical protein